MPAITIETIAHKNQRYNTLGDWGYDHDGNVQVIISEELDIPNFFLVAIHELVEAFLCWNNFIKPEIVDAWDKDHPELDEPGADPECPYYDQHVSAELIERLLAKFINLDWDGHEAHCHEVRETFDFNETE